MDYIDNVLDAIKKVINAQPLDDNTKRNVRETKEQLVHDYPNRRDYIETEFNNICQERGISSTFIYE